MEFRGDNTRYGQEDVAVNDERSVGMLVDEGDAFPLGVRGLLPVVTSRKKKGGHKTVYAFPFAAGTPDDEDELAHELHEAVDFLNVLLEEASYLSDYVFGSIETVNTGVPEKGYAFTRVEQLPPDADGRPAISPIHLRIETGEKPSAPGSISAVIEYDFEGYVRNVLITEYDPDRSVYRVTAAPERFDSEVLVQRVTFVAADGERTQCLYDRFRDEREREREDDRY